MELEAWLRDIRAATRFLGTGRLARVLDSRARRQPGWTHGQGVHVVLGHKRQPPEANHLLLSTIAQRALMQAWPCRQGSWDVRIS
jgi:hypothetical protein